MRYRGFKYTVCHMFFTTLTQQNGEVLYNIKQYSYNKRVPIPDIQGDFFKEGRFCF